MKLRDLIRLLTAIPADYRGAEVCFEHGEETRDVRVIVFEPHAFDGGGLPVIVLRDSLPAGGRPDAALVEIGPRPE